MEEMDHSLEITMKKSTKRKATMCLENCNSNVILEVANSMGMQIVKFTDQWDLYWSNVPMDLKRAKNMKSFQKTNHFPGMSEICRKDSLARNLNTMMNYFPDDYNFFPKTWFLPLGYTKLQSFMNENKNLTYILKPSTGCRGTGIYLTKSLKKISQHEKMICQLYISKPLLIDGYKFDMRLYVLISSCDPLVIYVYNDGLVRLATEPYKKPALGNLKNLYMHLTNYSVNKHSKMYVDNENYGSKRRIKTLNARLENNGYDVQRIWKEIDDVIIKTVILAYPFVLRSYRAYYSSHKYTEACFDLLGFDILLDEKGKPHLLEVNHSPDFHTETILDQIVKHKLLTDTFKLLQLDKSTKQIIAREEKWRIEQQTINSNRDVYKQRKIQCKEYFERENKKWASENMGDYRLVFSGQNSNLYERYFYWNESTLYQNTPKTTPEPNTKPKTKPKPTTKSETKLKSESKTKLKSVQINTEIMNKYSDGTDNAKINNEIEKDATLSSIKNTSNFIKKEKYLRKKPVLFLVPKNHKVLMNAMHKNNVYTKSKLLVGLTTKKLNQQQIELAKRSLRMQSNEFVQSNDRIIDKIKQKNKKMFPDIQSRLFSKCFGKKKCFWDGWKDSPIDQIDENDRLDNIFDRSELVFNLNLKEQFLKGQTAVSLSAIIRSFGKIISSSQMGYPVAQKPRLW
ncbi:Tubulin-tyrosine ligase/Tubulin polyglutamylase [Cinara cedri]|uniref:Tubulin-tyrosine ligase/Tubulin polyglutamylase n=1 Tax=Cinara cedri TaxID=506608 RepID=A0A5E4MDX0_9HEMI|nr:Tubulin-tyrosine ligase/Tubulin polyglutamylase [Cinara cedri]